jgi:diguanylate cyclase (GGDEF)-like protein/PAS domain S-box-containing protein
MGSIQHMAFSPDILNSSILIVDDRETDVAVVESMLRGGGYVSVSSTTNPLEVCDLHRAHRYDLILLDLMMPRMDGFQVMEALREMENVGPGETLPVLVITAQSENKKRALQSGAKGFIAKPFDQFDVLTHIRDVLEIRLLQKELHRSAIGLRDEQDERGVGRAASPRETEELFDQLAVSLPNIFWIWDVKDEMFRYVNPSWENMTGRRVTSGDRLEKLFDAIHPEDKQRVMHESRDLSDVSMDHDYRLLLADNSVRWVHSRTFPIKDSKGVHRVVGLMDDITHRKETHQAAWPLPHYDSLTSLPNRTLFHESLRKTIKQAEAGHRIVSVLYLDIDNFRNINDTLGRAAGDEVLRQFSLRLLECLRVTDTVARLGGDEFGCILVTPDGSGDAGLVASKIREALRLPFNVEGTSVVLTASMGISVYPSDSMDADTLVKNGDTAMYRSKKAGRDTYRFFTAEMNARAVQKLDQENALRKALELNQFVLHYQPKVELTQGRITGVEALLRWDRPGYGFTQPAEFISILEQTGLISQVGAWVIETACKQIAEWRNMGIGEIAVSVNVSGRQFSQATLSHDVVRFIEENDVHPQLLEFELQTERALRQNSIDSDLLELELTEGSVAMHATKMIGILNRLKKLGIRISVDDFGTGYSSLAYVKRFPIDVLKIDRSFITDVTTNAADAAITGAIIDMAHSLDVRVVAEGVETIEQLDFLRQRGCDEIQGYYFSEPLSAAEITNLLKSNTLLKPAPFLAS